MAMNFKRDKFRTTTEPVMRRDLLRAKASLDFPSVAAAASATLTIACVGARVGDDVHVANDAPTAGLLHRAYVSANDVVTVQVTNVTAAPIDQAAKEYRVLVFKAY